MTAQSQSQISQIKLSEPTENQWSRPVEYTFGGLWFKSQIALTDLRDTSDNRINPSSYGDITRTDVLCLVQEADFSLAPHPLYVEISEGRKSKTKEAFESLKGNYYLTGSGEEYFGSKAVLGMDPIVVDREKGLVRYRYAVHVERMNSDGNLQEFLHSPSSWFSKQADRKLNHPIYLYESNEDGLKYVDAGFRSDGDVDVGAYRHPLNRKLLSNLNFNRDAQ